MINPHLTRSFRTLLIPMLLLVSQSVFAQAGGENQATATLINSIPYVGQGDNSNAVDDYAENCPDVNNGGNGRDHVYRYNNGGVAMTVDVSLCIAMTDYDSQLYIYEDSCFSGSAVACREDGCQSPAFNQNYNSQIQGFTMSPNKTYYFVVDGYNGNGGNYQINIDSVMAPIPAIITFTNSSSQLTTDVFSGVALAVVDMNGDLLDDVVRLDDRREMYVNYQLPAGGFNEVNHGNFGSGNHWSTSMGDFDENGSHDVIVGGAYNGVYARQANANGTTYNTSTLPQSTIFLQGSNFADINNDGHLDIFGCHDDNESHKWEGDGTGSFSMNMGLINTTTNPSSDNSGNYASMWTDYDNDGDLDMYLSKCRQGVSSPADPRRINMLFQNDGKNNYTEVGAAAGLRDSAQTWLSDFGDIDNDGDLDVLIINHDMDSRIMENNGDGTFTDISAAAGFAGQIDFVGVQGFFRDFNNDGYLDILATGGSHKLFINNGNKTFTVDQNGFVSGSEFMESCAIGDLNNDGFLDVDGGYANIYNGPSSIHDKLWLNDGTPGNNYFYVNAVGTVSNINGIGARVEIYGPWGMMIREIRSGEGYGVMNSFSQHFGIGTATTIDSVYIRWPSGIVDRVTNLAANSAETIVEGQSPAYKVIVSADSTVGITGNAADLWGSVRLQDSSSTAISIKYWEQGSSTIDSVYIGDYAFNNNIAKFDFDEFPTTLLPNTTYMWMVDAIYDVNNLFGSSEHIYSDTLTFTTGPAVAIAPVLDGLELQLYPNPFHTEAYLEISGYDFVTKGDLVLEIYEVRGKLVRTLNQINSDRTVIERGGLQNGIYIYQISTKAGASIGSGRLLLQ